MQKTAPRSGTPLFRVLSTHSHALKILSILLLQAAIYSHLTHPRGAFRWAYPTGGQIAGTVVVSDGVAYVCSGDQNLYALNASNGEKLWNFPVPVDRDSMSPAVCNGVVYVDSGGELYAVNAMKGS